MKKIMLSMLVLLVVLWSSSFVFAQGKGKGAGKQNKQSSEIQNKGKSQEKKETAKKEVDKGNSKVEAAKEKKQAGKGKAKSEALEKGAAKGKSAENIGKGKGHQQQMKALKKQMLHEEAKYKKRQAHFKRIRELATTKGNTTVLERLNILEEKEQGRYGGKQKRMMERMLQLETGDVITLQKTVEKKAAEKSGKVKTEAEKAEDKIESEAEEAEEAEEDRRSRRSRRSSRRETEE